MTKFQLKTQKWRAETSAKSFNSFACERIIFSAAKPILLLCQPLSSSLLALTNFCLCPRFAGQTRAEKIFPPGKEKLCLCLRFARTLAQPFVQEALRREQELFYQKMIKEAENKAEQEGAEKRVRCTFEII